MQFFQPAFAPRFSVNVVPGEGIFLIAENDSRALSGDLAERLAPLIDGQRTVLELANAIPDISVEEVATFVQQLLAEGTLVAAYPGLPPNIAAFWSELGVAAESVPRLLEAMPVTIRASHPEWQHQAEQLLRSFGMTVSPQGQLLVALVDDYLDESLLGINSYCLERGIPWLACKPSGVNIWLGPLLIPGETACWQCFRTRLLRNRQTENYLFRKTGVLPPGFSRTSIPAISDQAINMMALQVIRFVALGLPSPLSSQLIVQRTLHQEQSHHAVQRLPQCSVCGDPELGRVSTESVSFADEQKVASLTDGGERTRSPEQTFHQLSHLVSPLSGVVKELQPSPWNSSSPINTFVAGHNFALSDHWQGMASHLRASSGGKGKTEVQARTSALCEALERHSGRFLGEEHTVRGSFKELAGAIHPNDSMLFSNLQYAERDSLNERGGAFTYVPLPFEEEAEILWSPVFSMTSDTVRYLPTSYLFYGYPEPLHELTSFADSNGAASGTSFTDAALQGFYEVVERDAVAIWWYNQIARPAVDLSTLDDPYIDQLQAFCRTQGREFYVIDITHDLGIPVFVAISRRVDSAHEDIVFGFGAHLNARIAILRAITEMNQFLPAVLTRDAQGGTIYEHQDPDAMQFWKTANTTNQPYLGPLPGDSRSISCYPDVSELSLRDQLLDGFDRIEKLGMEILIQNQSRADIGLPVAKVIIPGMRHFWRRLAPGRLYDVPVQLGWQHSVEAEERLNPVPMFV